QLLAQLAAAAELSMGDYFPVSARTGEGVGALVDAIAARLPEGPAWYPDDMVTDVPEAFWVAELVREQLLARVREEVPHSIATRVTEWEWPRIRCEILVERESQKGATRRRVAERRRPPAAWASRGAARGRSRARNEAGPARSRRAWARRSSGRANGRLSITPTDSARPGTSTPCQKPMVANRQ